MIGQRLKKLRKTNHLTQKELAEKADTTTQTVIRYEKSDYNNVTTEKLTNIAKALDTSTDYLLGLSDFSIVDFYDQSDSEMISVPIYGKIPAGKPIEALQVDYGYVEVEASKFKGGKQFIGLKVKGDSMYPYYMDGDTIIVEITPEAQSGEDVVAFVGYDNEATLKRFHKKEKKVELEPINKYYSVIEIEDDKKPFRILGVVRELRREVS